MPPRLSVICSARVVAERTLVLLDALRPVANELILAVDSRGDQSLGAASGRADRLISFEFADAIERQWAWLAAQASGRWLFWVDDDEFPSIELLRELPHLVAATDVTHYQLRRRWVWPSVEQTLDEMPWEPEFVPRLFRLEPALVTFPGRFHIPMRPNGPFRWVDAPLYHLDLVVNDEPSRREKATAYEFRRPGLRIAGRPLNEAFYVPETRSPRTVEIPAADQHALRRFVDAAAAPLEGHPAANTVRGVRDEIDALWEGADRRHDDYAAELDLTRPLRSMEVGVELPVELIVTNRSSRIWRPRHSAAFEVDASYRWRNSDGTMTDGLRTSLPAPLHPGESMLVLVDVEPPSDPGTHVLEFDLVQEGVRWFGAAISTEVTVVPRAKVGLVAVDVELASRAAQEVTAELPTLDVVLLAPEDVEWELPYDVERFEPRRHSRELDALVVVGPVRGSRKRTRMALLVARVWTLAQGGRLLLAENDRDVQDVIARLRA